MVSESVITLYHRITIVILNLNIFIKNRVLIYQIGMQLEISILVNIAQLIIAFVKIFPNAVFSRPIEWLLNWNAIGLYCA